MVTVPRLSGPWRDCTQTPKHSTQVSPPCPSKGHEDVKELLRSIVGRVTDDKGPVKIWEIRRDPGVVTASRRVVHGILPGPAFGNPRRGPRRMDPTPGPCKGLLEPEGPSSFYPSIFISFSTNLKEIWTFLVLYYFDDSPTQTPVDGPGQGGRSGGGDGEISPSPCSGLSTSLDVLGNPNPQRLGPDLEFRTVRFS